MRLRTGGKRGRKGAKLTERRWQRQVSKHIDRIVQAELDRNDRVKP
jgi:hypothetical protein